MASDLFDELYKKNQTTLTRLQRNGEEKLVRAYAEALDEIRKNLKKIYRKYQENGTLSNQDKTVYNRLKQLEDRIKDILNRKNIEIDELLETLTGEQYEEAFFRMAYAFDEGTGISWNWGLIPEEAVNEIVTSPLEKLFKSEAVRKARDGAFERIRKDLELAIIRGDSFQTLSRRIAKSIGVDNTGNGYSYGRRGLAAKAMTIARTEGMRALNAGHQRAYEEAEKNGIPLTIFWDATLDSRTRPSHGALDGQMKDEKNNGWYVPELGKFVSGPGQSGVASFDINCRCRTHASITGKLPGNRYIRSKSTSEPYQTYTEWKKQIQGDIPSSWAYSIRTKGMSIERQLRSTNPNFSLNDESWYMNCQRCVPAYEMRRRGYDIEAKPYISRRDPFMNKWDSIFENESFTPVDRKDNEADIRRIMSGYGDGARAEIYVHWKKEYGGHAHVFVAEQVNGKTMFIDPQSGKTDVSEYFSRCRPSETKIARIDNLRPTALIDECAKPRQNNRRKGK